MRMKWCPGCEDHKPIEEFAPNKARKDGVQSHCRTHHRANQRKHYQTHAEAERERSRQNSAAYREEIRGRIRAYLEAHPCVDCGETDPDVLEFDHVEGEKHYNVAAMAGMRLSWATILQEIWKCVVRCANCHRKRHQVERRWAERAGFMLRG